MNNQINGIFQERPSARRHFRQMRAGSLPLQPSLFFQKGRTQV